MLNFDRYHATMGNFSLSEHALLPGGKLLADKQVTFYATQRKLKFAPCVGHERLRNFLFRNGNIDVPHLRFLKQDKANLVPLANKLDTTSNPFSIRTVTPGTIMFSGEPFADITGPFCLTQMQEVKFEHSFDEPMTVAGRALKMRIAAEDRHLSAFSLRRDGSPERSLEVNQFAYIGGFDDTSFMEAAYKLDINAVGTMAHYLVQVFQEYSKAVTPELDSKGKSKHFQQIAFERWLDAHPNGTTLLIDAITLKLGIIHAIRAAKSSAARQRALKLVRIDSGDLIKNSLRVRAMLDANGLNDVGIILTSDLDKGKIKEIVEKCPFIYGFGVGTKLAAEVDSVAGVIFKLCAIEKMPTMKLSETPGKETLPGKTQVWRCIDESGFYVKDIITTDLEVITGAVPLLRPFFGKNHPNIKIESIHKQREYVLSQMSNFRDIENYPVELSFSLSESIKNIRQKMLEDNTDENDIVMIMIGGLV